MNNPINTIDPNGTEVYFCHGTYDKYTHSVVCLDTLCFGLMPDTGRGFIVDFIGACTFVTGHIESKPFKTEFCKEMKTDQSCDQKEYEGCILEIFQEEIGYYSVLPYSAGVYNCSSWAKEVIITCQQKACFK